MRLLAADRDGAAYVAGFHRRLEREHPHLKETLLSAMGNIETGRLLDPRFLDLEGTSESGPVKDQCDPEPDPFAILSA